MLDGVPMNWMTRWSSPFPPVRCEAHGARFTCVDGHEYVDFCLGDTGAMAGHSPDASVRAIAEQAGARHHDDAADRGLALGGGGAGRRFGLQYWQVALTATDANRFAVRLARHITSGPGSWSSTTATTARWTRRSSPSTRLPGPSPATPARRSIPTVTTKVIEFNDVAALERALEPGDVACVLAEPALTNIGIMLPDAGYHAELRRLTRETGTLLIIDETHTICAGPGGCTRAWGLDPDMVTLGKPIGGGVPAAVYGFGQAVADRIRVGWDYHAADECGIGGTLAGNALSLAAMRATLGEVLTEEAFARMIPLAEPLGRRRAGGHRRVRAAVGGQAPRLPRRVLAAARAAAQRRRGGRGRGRRARPLPAPLHAQPRHPDDAVPQHGAHGAGRRRRPTSTVTPNCCARRPWTLVD